MVIFRIYVADITNQYYDIPMNTYQRSLDLANEAQNKSLFLFGPRQTGKTSLLKASFPDSLFFNLLRADTFLKLSGNPSLIRQEILAQPDKKKHPIIIDEIQKLPGLLDEVHDLIESENARFILTGSNPRKLKSSGVNLLGGRARVRQLFPLTSREISDFSLDKVLNFGSIPSIYLSLEPEEDLLAYCGVYLQEEIQAEGVSRKIENFSRFLRSAALMNGHELNYEKVARDLNLPARTVREYFYILSDTLVGTLLEPYRNTPSRKAVAQSKFYFFDLGVSNILAGRFRVSESAELYGPAFEHFILGEIRAWQSYSKDRRPLHFWRDRSGNKVDFILGDESAIEVKSSTMVHPGQLKGLKFFSQDLALKHKVVVSRDSAPRRIDDIEILPWQVFLDQLWAGLY